MSNVFQESQMESLIDDIMENLIDYAVGEVVEHDEDGYDSIDVCWTNGDDVRSAIRHILRKKNIHFRDDFKSMKRAEKIFEFVKGEDRRWFLCFVFGLMNSRMSRSDVELMISEAKKLRNQKRKYESQKQTS